MGKHEMVTSEQEAILAVANALAATANKLASSAVRTQKVTTPGYAVGYIAALQDLLDEVGAVVPVGWQAP
jgi:hypothetical protein